MDELRACLPDVLNMYCGSPIRDRKRPYKIKCPNPAHQDNHPSCQVHPTKGVFHCFTCGFGNDVFNYVADREGLNLRDADKLKQKQNLHTVAKIIADIGHVTLKTVDGTEAKREERETKPVWKVQQRVDYAYLPQDIITRGMRMAMTTALYTWMSREFGENYTAQIMNRYCVGASKIEWRGNRATSFPYIDAEGRVIDCKIVAYNPETGSSKLEKDHNGRDKRIIRYVHKDYPDHQNPGLTLEGRRAPLCFFGEHLLKSTDPNARICIVESEKTALAMPFFYPEHLWVATGGKQQLTIDNCVEKCQSYRGRNVVLFPDRDGMEEWTAIAKALADSGFNVSVDNIVAKTAGEKNDDILDVVLMYRHGQRTAEISPVRKLWEEWKAENPLLEWMEKALECELMEY